ncbi:MAG TPA: type II toxin-antitoxin system VapC family toxin [Galbitalea sp.]
MQGSSSGYLLDSNVLLDIVTRDRVWFEWSAARVSEAMRNGTVSINPLIYAEVSASFSDIRSLDAALPETLVRRSILPYGAAFLAARAFLVYRRRGGERRSPLPDFYIGAHAVVQNLTLITRDARRYRTYFPTLSLISPDS